MVCRRGIWPSARRSDKRLSIEHGGCPNRRFLDRNAAENPECRHGINVMSILVAFIGAVILIAAIRIAAIRIAILRMVSGRRR